MATRHHCIKVMPFYLFRAFTFMFSSPLLLWLIKTLLFYDLGWFGISFGLFLFSRPEHLYLLGMSIYWECQLRHPCEYKVFILVVKLSSPFLLSLNSLCRPSFTFILSSPFHPFLWWVKFPSKAPINHLSGFKHLIED